MRKFRWAGAALAALLLAQEASAQFICPPFAAPGVVFGDGVFLHYRGRRLALGGYLHNGGVRYYGGSVVPVVPIYPYGVINDRVTVQVLPPPPLGVFGGSRALDDEIAGVDLDRIPLKRPPPEAKPEPGPGKPFEMPGVDVSVPKKPVRPEDLVRPKQPEPPKPEPPKPEPPKPEPKMPPKEEGGDETARLVELGLRSFREQEYGLAALRFRQAASVEPVRSRAFFLLAQAQFAVGKYKEAVQSIETGMRGQPDWPKAAFRPRMELYKGDEAQFDEHLQRLKQVLDRDGDNPAYLFLYAYELWFDGRRAEAVPFFQKARKKAADPAAIDAFLAAAPPGVLAAR